MSGNSPRNSKELPDFSISPQKLYRGNDFTARLAALTRVPIDYLLEFYDDSGSIVSVLTLPNTPEEIECIRPLAGTITYTLGNMPIRQIVESKFRAITLRGRSGIEPRQGYTRKGDLKFQDARDILLEFDGFVQDYTKSQEIYNRGFLFNRSEKRQPKLIFRAFNEDINLLVEPENWRWRRASDTSRLSYEWELTLTAYGYSDVAGMPKNAFSPLDEYAESVGNAVNSAATAIAIASNSATNLRNDVKAIVSPTLNALRNVGISAQLLAGSTRSLLAYPKEVLGNVARVARSFRQAVVDFSELTEGIGFGAELHQLRGIFGETENTTTRSIDQALFLAGGGPEDLNSQSYALTESDVLYSNYDLNNSNSRDRVLSVYITKEGDSLIKLADRVLGDANRWTELASLNNFSDLHTHENGILSPGTRLLLPAREFVTQVEQAVLGAKTTTELLGRDLAVDLRSGDLIIKNDDISLRIGPDNLEQGLAIRLLTKQNTLPMFPEYGLPIAPGIGMTRRVAAYAGLHCKEQVLRDSRVSEVRDISVQDEGDGISVSMRIVPVDGGDMNFISPLNTEK